eukprot:3900887-Amphidinium_carterae.1
MANADAAGHTGPLPDAPATAQTSVVSHVEAAIPEPAMPTAPATAESDVQDTGSNVPAVNVEAPEMTYMQQALSIIQAPFRANKKRGLSTGDSRGSSSEVFPSPRTHIQPQPEHTADQDQNMEGNIGEPTADVVKHDG